MAQAQVDQSSPPSPPVLSKSEISSQGSTELKRLVDSAEKLLANLGEQLAQEVIVKPYAEEDDDDEGSSGAASPASDQTDRLGLMSPNLITKLGGSKPSAQFQADFQTFADAYTKLSVLLKAAESYLPKENGVKGSSEGSVQAKEKRLEALRERVREKNKAVLYLIERVAELRQQLLFME